MDFNATMQEPAAELSDRRPIATRNLTANMLDGMVALNSGCASTTGEFYNEMPDPGT